MKGAPPYSCTRVRTFASSGVTCFVEPPARLNNAIAPPRTGTFSVQYSRPSALRRSPKPIPPAARASALKGEAQEPYGATAGAACDRALMTATAKRQMRTRRRSGAAMNFDRALLLMGGSFVAHRMLGCSHARHT